MRVGITLPQFRESAEASIRAARVAEAAGLDGVFAFDHLWAIGNPERRALNVWPLLGALAGETDRIALGSLVARVGLLPNAVLAHNFETLHRMLADRLIAGLGMGDRQSEPENHALGLPFAPVGRRTADLADACRRLRALGVAVWVGGTSGRVHRLAVDEEVVLNMWGVEPDAVAGVADVEVTWGGPAPEDAGTTGDLLARLAAAGATWAVVAPPYGVRPDPTAAVEMVAEARSTLR